MKSAGSRRRSADAERRQDTPLMVAEGLSVEPRRGWGTLPETTGSASCQMLVESERRDAVNDRGETRCMAPLPGATHVQILKRARSST